MEDYSFSFIHHDDPGWMDFVSIHPEANIFHHPAWINFLASTYGYLPQVAVVQNENGQIAAGLPLMELSGFAGNTRWVSLPFTDHCAPLFSNDKSLELLIENLVTQSRQKKETRLEFRWDIQSPVFFQKTQYVLTTTGLDLTQSQISKSIHNFRNIKKAEQRGVCIEKGNSIEFLEAFYRMHLETRRRHGVPIQPWQFFKRLREQILERGLGFIALAKKDGTNLAGVVFLKWNRTLTYKFAASSSDGREMFASDLLNWDTICYGIENGYQILDWGRTDLDDDGLRRFKLRWNSVEVPLVYSTSFPVNTSLLRQRLISLIKLVIRKSPLLVSRISGELLYKYFG